MKTKTTLLMMALLFVSTFSFAQSSFDVNTDKSSLKWLGKKVTGQHDGTINIKSGTIETDGSKLTGGSFIIDMTSIKVLDIEDADYNAKLKGHLESDDFFSVASHKEAKFVITGVKKADGDQYTITGDLTIKGITNSISFPAKVIVKKSGVIATADFTIDRTLWDVKYGSGSFFDGLGDKTIYDDIAFTLYLVSK